MSNKTFFSPYGSGAILGTSDKRPNTPGRKFPGCQELCARNKTKTKYIVLFFFPLIHSSYCKLQYHVQSAPSWVERTSDRQLRNLTGLSPTPLVFEPVSSSRPLSLYNEGTGLNLGVSPWFVFLGHKCPVTFPHRPSRLGGLLPSTLAITQLPVLHSRSHFGMQG